MKKFISALCVIFIILALAACGNDEATSITPPEPTGEGVINSNPETTVPTDTVETPEPTATGCPVCAEREEREELDNDAGGDVVEEPDWKDEFDEIIAPNGNRFKVPGYGFIVDTYKDRCLMVIGSKRELWLCTAENGFTKLSSDQLIINWTVAYDTVYWFNLDQDVWAVDWWYNAEAYLYCEDAIAVSPYTDEAEGAIVDRERPHWECYGLPIYDPYAN